MFMLIKLMAFIPICLQIKCLEMVCSIIWSVNISYDLHSIEQIVSLLQDERCTNEINTKMTATTTTTTKIKYTFENQINSKRKISCIFFIDIS